jgi:hypothetical protein
MATTGNRTRCRLKGLGFVKLVDDQGKFRGALRKRLLPVD